jgi:uncharacterized phage-associated protein
VAKIHDACDYIILSMTSVGNSDLSLLKLQKLLYYSQAWRLAFTGDRLFYGYFQAWIHGPVNRAVYDRFAPTKMLYAAVTREDVRPTFLPTLLTLSERRHIGSVLDTYGKYTGTQLEEIAHRERPWIEARKGIAANARCEEIISEATMQSYYSERLHAKRR